MIKKVLIFIIVSSFLMAMTPKGQIIGWFEKGYNGAYYFDLNIFWCREKSACVHEIGHMMDDQLEMISKSDDFITAIDYAIGSEEPSVCEYCVGRTTELYAEIFQNANGNKEDMPEYLQKFYNWDLAEYWLEKYSKDIVYFGTPH